MIKIVNKEKTNHFWINRPNEDNDTIGQVVRIAFDSKLYGHSEEDYTITEIKLNVVRPPYGDSK